MSTRPDPTSTAALERLWDRGYQWRRTPTYRLLQLALDVDAKDHRVSVQYETELEEVMSTRWFDPACAARQEAVLAWLAGADAAFARLLEEALYACARDLRADCDEETARSPAELDHYRRTVLGFVTMACFSLRGWWALHAWVQHRARAQRRRGATRATTTHDASDASDASDADDADEGLPCEVPAHLQAGLGIDPERMPPPAWCGQARCRRCRASPSAGQASPARPRA